MRAWLGDLGRLFWGYLYWNGRKSLFRMRGARGVAPCQHPSDSGRAAETGCEACRGWRSKGRFARLCPLLVADSAGRSVCSVSASQVRPFWRSALPMLGATAAALVLAVVLSAFAGLRLVGYRVPLYVVAWPPAWHRIHQARADYFYRMAQEALAEGDVRRCYLALSQASVLDPNNVSALRLLAQLAQIGNPDFSDSLYRRLLERRDGRMEETAEGWFRALLARGDFRGLGWLSARMLREGASHVPAWTQGLLFAERMGAGAEAIDGLLSAKPPIPAEARAVLSLSRAEPGRIEVSVVGRRTAFELYASLRLLIERGRASEVAAYLQQSASTPLAAYDHESLTLDAYASLGWRALREHELGSLADQGGAAAVTLVCANLVRYPDRDLAAGVFSRMDGAPLPVTVENVGPHMALLCMAGVNGLDAPLAAEAGRISKIMGGNFAAWGRIHDFFQGKAGGNPAVFLPALAQLPLEVTYAVVEHYHAPEARRR